MTITDSAHERLQSLLDQPKNEGLAVRIFSRGFG